MTIPRDGVKIVEIRENRHKGRRIGTWVPVAAGMGLFGLASRLEPVGPVWLSPRGKVVAAGGVSIALAGGPQAISSAGRSTSDSRQLLTGPKKSGSWEGQIQDKMTGEAANALFQAHCG